MHINQLANVRGLILAGGAGTRLRRVICDLPKVMAPVCGHPFLYWVLRYLVSQGLMEIVISTGYLSEVIEAYINGLTIGKARIYCVREETFLGTGGAVATAFATTDKPEAWLVWNGDTLMLTSIQRFYTEISNKNSVAGIIGMESGEGTQYGKMTVNTDGYVCKFAEKQPGMGIVNAGVYLFRDTEFFRPYILRQSSLEYDIIPSMIQSGYPIQAICVSDPFIDIGTPDSLASADLFIRKYFAISLL